MRNNRRLIQLRFQVYETLQIIFLVVQEDKISVVKKSAYHHRVIQWQVYQW